MNALTTWDELGNTKDEEMSVGVEPTRTGLQPVAWPSGFDIANETRTGSAVSTRTACDHLTSRTIHPQDAGRERKVRAPEL